MTLHYTAVESQWAEENRQKKEDHGIALVQCKDGVWRTAAERDAWDTAAEAQMKVLS